MYQHSASLAMESMNQASKAARDRTAVDVVCVGVHTAYVMAYCRTDVLAYWRTSTGVLAYWRTGVMA